MQKTYWLQGRSDLSLPLLGSQVDVGGDTGSPAICVQATY